MEIVNYDNFVAIIIESKALDYDVFELKRISWLVNFLDESIIIENEDVFLKIFSDLLYYFDVEAKKDSLFKQIIDDLTEIIKLRNLTNLDIRFILSKNEINVIVEKFKKNKVSKDVLINQLKKYFKEENFIAIKDYLFEQKIEI